MPRTRWGDETIANLAAMVKTNGRLLRHHRGTAPLADAAEVAALQRLQWELARRAAELAHLPGAGRMSDRQRLRWQALRDQQDAQVGELHHLAQREQGDSASQFGA